jgi:Spy/CpxP family protein refolding chaperone
MRSFIARTALAVAFAIAIPSGALAQAAAGDGTDLKALRAQAATPADKRKLVAAELALTEAEAKRFWPVYDSYQRRLEANNRRYSRAVQEVVSRDKSIGDAYARNLVKELQEIEADEARASKSLYSGVLKALPGAKAVRYLHLEAKLQAGYRYEVASTLPLLK